MPIEREALKLLTTRNTKTLKGIGAGYTTYILHLSPANISGHEVCPFRTKGCTEACLNTAGRGVFPMVQDARIKKTKLFFDDRSHFMALLIKDIKQAIRQAKRQGLTPCIRLNGTSDILWESIPCQLDGIPYPNIFQAFPALQFYDYTKYPIGKRNTTLPNYHLTFSRGESKANQGHARVWAEQGYNVAIVFKSMPRKHEGVKVISGDDTDLRFLDRQGVVIGLKAKGKARRDTTGFVL